MTAQDPPSKGAQDAPPDAPKPKSSPFSTRRLTPQAARTSRPNEKAILDGMRWLIRHQNEDGSWCAGSIGARCPTSPPCVAVISKTAAEGDVGVTSLALATFLGAGFSPASKQDIVDTTMAERHKIGKVIGNGVGWLVKQQAEDGTWPVSTCGLENQSLATLVLAEALGLSGEPAFQAPAQRAVDALQRAQCFRLPLGGKLGWAHCASPGAKMYEEISDLYATAWAVQALVAAREAGLTVDDEALAGAMAYSDEEWKSFEKLGENGPRSGPQIFTLALIRILVRPLPSDPVLEYVRKAIRPDFMVGAEMEGRHAFDQSFVVVHLHGEASTIRDPEAWKRWTEGLPPAIVASQDHSVGTCHNGGWLAFVRFDADAGPAAWTAHRMLALENYYRYESKFAAPKPK